ncbi:hypothetical protein GCM10022243_58080 [Saccharothrix violaceirubra]|uniref:Immunity protein Imm1 n=1 Tax=Saccharothrix violaceirubra TaxID=413306 RepID=A0A7W7WW56_9PSEU|nr:Imm1 family immunity protein [Saccharothrix violaceirubra]MBB4965761.1 hypothetical protein [Saccharothrix violaceirubra]
MSPHELEVWFDAAQDETVPVLVRTDAELDALLDRLVDRDLPHPPNMTLTTRPLVGPHATPDHLVKIDTDRSAGLGAILLLGPLDIVPTTALDHDRIDPEGGIWVTRTDPPAPDTAPPLYIDKATRTRYPHDAALPLATWRIALHELLHTGLRPTTVDWQPSDVY